MKVFDVFSEGFDILMDGIGCDTSNLDQTVVLDEDGVTCQVTMNDGLLKNICQLVFLMNSLSLP